MFWKVFHDTPQVQEYYLHKIKIIQLCRAFFDQAHYQELEPPLLNTALLPESYVDVFQTEGKRLTADGLTTEVLFLPTSPEAFSKKMLVAGIGNNYCISKSFRNSEPQSNSHQLEFTLLEWYSLGFTLEQMMGQTEALVRSIHEAFPFPEPLDPSPPWKRITVRQALFEASGIDLEQSWDTSQQSFSLEKLQRLLPTDFKDPHATSWDELFDHLLLTYIEPALSTKIPTILYNYPRHSTPLAKAVPGETTSDLLWAGRFEVYWGGYELCDAYWEQTDYEALQKSFAQQEKKIAQARNKTQYPTDTEFLEAVKQGLPECSGNAFGLDRLALLHSGLRQLPRVS